ncbi:MAG: DUF3883 domain-containing protein [Bacteroidales bacterium]|nr:DUF3883 domain-containing protein [Bacteroidales bacterium]
MQSPWSPNEIRLIVQDYFVMLLAELRNEPYNKAQYRRALKQKISRSAGSIERKHMNISAVLIKYGRPFIQGYKPYKNFQGDLEFAVLDYLENHLDLDQEFESFTKKDIIIPEQSIDFNKWIDTPPIDSIAAEPRVAYKRRIRKIDFLAAEQANQKTGMAGEELVMKYEMWRLQRAGKDNLADKVEWVSRDKGDGAGFDILSRNMNGTDRYIEVKSTKLGKMTPLYVSGNELDFSKEKDQNFHLYRVFQMRKSPKLFTAPGRLDHTLHLEAVNYVGKFSNQT